MRLHGHREGAHRRDRLGRLWALLGAGVLLVGGACGLEAGSGLCTETTITAPPIRVTDRQAPLTFTATLEADGEPVAGVDLVFLIHRVYPGRPPVAVNIGTASTGPDGVARQTYRTGFEGFARGNVQPIAYGAEFRPVADVAGVQYCRSQGRGELTVG